MRILHLTRTTVEQVPGGLEHHVAYLTEALRQRGHQVEVLSLDSSGRWSAREPLWRPPSRSRLARFFQTRLGCRLSSALDTATTLLRRVHLDLRSRTAAARVAQLAPDIIHQHTYLGALALSWRLAKRYPVVFTNHTGAYIHLDRFWPTRRAQAWLLGLFDEIIAPSRELLPKIARSHYVPNGVDLKVFFPVDAHEQAQLREELGCQDRVVFVCPRRWAPTKGIIYLARALSLLAPELLRRSTFLFAGNETPGYENYQGSVRAALRNVPAADVRILGNLDHAQIARLMNASDACVIPSILEATSLACLEAMACGVPVLGTVTGGLPELIEEGHNGWLVPPGDPVALARALELIILSPDTRDAMRAAALETIRGRYSWDLIAAQTERIYQRAHLTARPGRAAAIAGH